MKRLSTALLVLLFVMAAGLAAQDATVIKVKVQAANVRTQPDMSAAVIRQVKLGTLLESRRQVGDWFEVTLTDERGASVTGYINSTVVDVVGGGARTGGQTGGQQAQVTKPAEGAPTIIVQQQVQQGQTNTQVSRQAQTGGSGASSGGGGFKIMGGLGMANISMTAPDAESQASLDKYKKSKTGLAGGIGLALGSRIGFELDLLYLQKGVRFQGTETEGGETASFDIKTNFNMISVPLLLRFNILDSPSAPSIYLLGGGEIAYILDGKVDYTFTAGGETEKGSEKIEKENLNQIDYGAIVGGGIGLNLGGMQFFIEGRYHIGMSNLEKSSAGTVVESDESFKPKTSLLLFMAGFKF